MIVWWWYGDMIGWGWAEQHLLQCCESCDGSDWWFVVFVVCVFGIDVFVVLDRDLTNYVDENNNNEGQGTDANTNTISMMEGLVWLLWTVVTCIRLLIHPFCIVLSSSSRMFRNIDKIVWGVYLHGMQRINKCECTYPIHPHQHTHTTIHTNCNMHTHTYTYILHLQHYTYHTVTASCNTQPYTMVTWSKQWHCIVFIDVTLCWGVAFVFVFVLILCFTLTPL